MNSLASILYSSPSAKTKKRKNLSFQPSIKPSSTIYPKSLKYKASNMLLRSSTPKTPLTTAAHPVSTSSYFSTNSSPQSPRCSTPVFAKQRRTRPFIACELCRQRAFESLNENKNEKKNTSHHHRSTTICHYQTQMSTNIHRRQSSIEQLLVWIV